MRGMNGGYSDCYRTPKGVISQSKRTKALMQLAKLAKGGEHQELIWLFKHLESELARYSASHMAEVWHENERLKLEIEKMQEGEGAL